MNTNLIKAIGFALAIMVAPLAARAQNPFQDPASAKIAASPEFKAFVDSYVLAINSKDREKLKACLHTKSLPILANDKEFSDNWFKNRFSNAIPAKRDVFVTTIARDAALPFAQFGVVFPVRPTHQVQISFDTAPNKKTGVVAWLVMENDKWLEVVPSAPVKK